MLDAFNPIMRRFQVFVWNQDNLDLMECLNLDDFTTFFVQQEGCDIDRNLDMDDGGAVLHRFFFDDPEDLQCGGFCITDMAGPVATWTGDMAAFRQGRAQTLT